jgi:hypothetical protein
MEAENVNFDNEVLAFLSKRKSELIEEHGKYINEKPEIREVLNDFLSSVLLSKPVRNCCDNRYLGRCLCLCEGILPSVQPHSVEGKATYYCGSVRCGQDDVD